MQKWGKKLEKTGKNGKLCLVRSATSVIDSQRPKSKKSTFLNTLSRMAKVPVSEEASRWPNRNSPMCHAHVTLGEPSVCSSPFCQTEIRASYLCFSICNLQICMVSKLSTRSPISICNHRLQFSRSQVSKTIRRFRIRCMLMRSQNRRNHAASRGTDA